MYKFLPSPNYSNRADKISAIVIHHTDMGDCDTAIKFLCDKDNQVSAHYIIAKDGKVFQLVEEQFKAWHAGKSYWQGQENVNEFSIGIELDNNGYENFSMLQMLALEKLCLKLIDKYNIRANRILSHADIAPGRKFDPHPLFSWQQLAHRGIGLFYEVPKNLENITLFHYLDKHEEILQISSLLQQYGYNIKPQDKFDSQMLHVVTAFQRHFCPHAFKHNYFDKWHKYADKILHELIKLKSQVI